MKTRIYSKIYENSYKDILQTTDKITFEKFIELRESKLIDSQKVHFVMPEDGTDFGHFEIEKKIPSYRYDIFFEQSYAK